MWNNCTHYLNQISQPSTPKSSSPSSSMSSYDQKTLSPRVRFPHLFPDSLLVPTLHQFSQMSASPGSSYYANRACGSPVYAFPAYPMSNSSWPLSGGSYSPNIRQSPRVYSPHPFVGKRFGLIPGTPRQVAAEEEERQRRRPSELESAEGLSGSCRDKSSRTIGRGLADEEASQKMERFKIRTVDIDEVVVVQEDDKR